MGDHLTLERYYWFDGQVRANRFPNANTLAEKFEISSKTAQRTLDFMRDRICAPLEYDSVHKGYRYSDDTFSLPSFQVSQEEVVSILLARNLLSNSAGGLISRDIQSFGRKLLATLGHIGFSQDKLRDAFSAVWNGYSPSQSSTFRVVLNALLRNRLLSCRYTSPASGQETERTIAPHHLQHYMGSWVLIGWCNLKQDWRKFFLSRMSNPIMTDESFDPRPKKEWQPLIHASFGIFQGGDPIPVILQFNPFRAQWIREQVWHPDQKMETLPDGGLRMVLPVTDFREVKLRVLQFGADVEVIEPEELRKEIREEIRRMGKIYRGR
jgi:predicted DNA-binding transcriptional regulator YafY